jgi:hypothetical protein
MEKTESATAKNAEELRVLTGGGKLAETRRETEEQIWKSKPRSSLVCSGIETKAEIRY